MNIIAFSYAKRALVSGSREHRRIVEYATVLSEHHVVVFTKKTERYPAHSQSGNTYFYATNSTNKVGMVIDAYKIGRSIFKKSPEKNWLVSAQDPLSSSLPALMLSLFSGTVLHVQMHGDIFNKNFFSRSIFTPCKRIYAIFVIRHAQKIRVVSERIKKSLLTRGVKAEKITVLPIQSDLQEFLKVGAHRNYSTAPDIKFLYVGRFSPEKNLLFLIQAFAAARAEGVTLLLLGDGPTKASLQTEINRLGVSQSIVFLPWSNDVAQVMGEVDVLCLASLHEGYGMVLDEAMAAGLPIVTTDVGCAGDVVKDGQHGIVVPVDDMTAYIKAIKILSNDAVLRAQYGRNSFARAQERTLSHKDYLHALAQSYTL